MKNPRDIRRRIRSIGSTAQITKAMQMVAASKMRKAQQAALEVRPFVQLLYRIRHRATTRAIEFTHPLLEVREVRRRAIVLVASDKGLCGALNSNVFRLAGRYDPHSTLFITAGRKAAQFVARTRRHIPAFAEALLHRVDFALRQLRARGVRLAKRRRRAQRIGGRRLPGWFALVEQRRNLGRIELRLRLGLCLLRRFRLSLVFRFLLRLFLLQGFGDRIDLRRLFLLEPGFAGCRGLLLRGRRRHIDPLWRRSDHASAEQGCHRQGKQRAGQCPSDVFGTIRYGHGYPPIDSCARSVLNFPLSIEHITSHSGHRLRR